jgi:hypothetical protein
MPALSLASALKRVRNHAASAVHNLETWNVHAVTVTHSCLRQLELTPTLIFWVMFKLEPMYLEPAVIGIYLNSRGDSVHGSTGASGVAAFCVLLVVARGFSPDTHSFSSLSFDVGLPKTRYYPAIFQKDNA